MKPANWMNARSIEIDEPLVANSFGVLKILKPAEKYDRSVPYSVWVRTSVVRRKRAIMPKVATLRVKLPPWPAKFG